MVIKLKKIKKVKRMRGKGMGTHGWGARKKHMGSGHRGGFGMAGTGKKADQKKSLVIKKYKQYFGKQGETSKSTKRRHNNVMNLDYIQKNLESLKKKYLEKDILNLKDYKILGKGEINHKLKIKAKAASETAKEKIKKAGGEIIIPDSSYQKDLGESEEKGKGKIKKPEVKNKSKEASTDVPKGKTKVEVKKEAEETKPVKTEAPTKA